MYPFFPGATERGNPASAATPPGRGAWTVTAGKPGRDPRQMEAVMNHIRRIAMALAALATATLGIAAVCSTAFAMRMPPSGGSGGSVPAAPTIHTIVTGGMPGWQIALIAVSAALIAAVLAVMVDRAWAARRYTATPGA